MKGFAFDRVFDMESQQQDIFDWGVKGIVEGELSDTPSRVPLADMILRCNDWVQWNIILLWSDWFRKDI
jgi:hypothetical protein